jgi:methionine-rich copper-binding protein CopC
MFKLRPATAAFALVLAAAPAFAHSHPVTMLPAKDSTVSAPTELSVVFSEDLDAKGSSLKLENNSGEIVSKDAPVLDPANAKHMTLKLPKLAPGVYTVAWVTLSTDGHRLTGRYAFTVK